ncbi:putative NBD/HSP70 family sugar kinase [Allocatelliglobosispora scoriae]|uniref:Putative NBD/HSP70 family sugar kinase n=1 Tax=Allocatelliglobosispora scoriae TaxID=643052 RepID=A0A841C0H5_9ACTN|nr:ROK family transcriptional regulator [Allocatelliglobosispora scoriae]MBB5872552.1 putative NBD/HSP70 family sugar kinase [Allocatelliglobosispora scoriae]
MVTRRATVRDMRRANRAVLLSKIYLDGPLSRQELTQLTALSQASVSTLVAEFIEEGLVEEAGFVESDGGRPRVLLQVRPTFGYVIGVDVGETRVQVELFDLAMQALAKADYPIARAEIGPDVIVDDIIAGIGAVTAQASVDPATVLGIGIGVPGVVDQGEAGLVHAQTLGWDGVPLRAMLKAGTSIPIHIDNGAKTLGQAEMWFGAGRGAQHAVIALVGSGVGAAVVADGGSYRGSHSSAGEWGHTTIVYGGRLCRCGSRGCLEAYVGAEGVLDRYREANRGQAAHGSDEESAIGAMIAAAETSKIAQTVLTETVGYLGAGIATLVNLFNPERIVLGGWAGLALGERWLPEIRAAAGEHALRRPFSQTTIEMCRLGPDAVALGAATLPVAQLLAEGGKLPVPQPRRESAVAGLRPAAR